MAATSDMHFNRLTRLLTNVKLLSPSVIVISLIPETTKLSLGNGSERDFFANTALRHLVAVESSKPSYTNPVDLQQNPSQEAQQGYWLFQVNE